MFHFVFTKQTAKQIFHFGIYFSLIISYTKSIVKTTVEKNYDEKIDICTNTLLISSHYGY